jgi:outer membrane protein assembly factor BamB
VLNRNGSLRWRFNTRSVSGGSLAVGADDTVYVGTAHSCGLVSWDGDVYALSADGLLRWSFSAGGEVDSLAVGGDGTVYAATKGGKVYALRP